MGTIKFALLCDGQPVRTLEKLQENFNINDVLEHYESGKLADWLESRDYEEELETLKKINKNVDLLELAKELCKLFDIAVDDSRLKQAVDSQLVKKEAYHKAQPKDHVGAYIEEYKALAKELLNRHVFNEAVLNRIRKEYKPLYELNKVELYHNLRKNNKKTAMDEMVKNDAALALVVKELTIEKAAPSQESATAAKTQVKVENYNSQKFYEGKTKVLDLSNTNSYGITRRLGEPGKKYIVSGVSSYEGNVSFINQDGLIYDYASIRGRVLENYSVRIKPFSQVTVVYKEVLEVQSYCCGQESKQDSTVKKAEGLQKYYGDLRPQDLDNIMPLYNMSNRYKDRPIGLASRKYIITSTNNKDFCFVDQNGNLYRYKDIYGYILKGFCVRIEPGQKGSIYYREV